MNSIDFAELTPEQAEEWRLFTANRGPAALAEMAIWMDADDGPIDLADASWASLVPVWSWAVDFASRGGPSVIGMPQRMGSRALAFGLSQSNVGPVGPLAEDLEQYVFAVLHRLDASTTWSVFSSPTAARVKSGDHLQTGVAVGDAWYALGMNLPSSIRKGFKPGHAAAAPTALQTILVKRLLIDTFLASEPGPSILRPHLNTTPWSPLVPDFSGVRAAAASPERFGSTSGILSPGATIDDLDSGAGFNTAELLRFLAPFGLELDAEVERVVEGMSLQGLRGGIFEGGVLVESYGRPGIISALVVEPSVVSAAEWTALSGAAKKFAHEHGGAFIELEE